MQGNIQLEIFIPGDVSLIPQLIFSVDRESFFMIEVLLYLQYILPNPRDLNWKNS